MYPITVNAMHRRICSEFSHSTAMTQTKKIDSPCPEVQTIEFVKCAFCYLTKHINIQNNIRI